VEATGCFEKSVDIFQSTRYHTPEDIYSQPKSVDEINIQ